MAADCVTTPFRFFRIIVDREHDTMVLPKRFSKLFRHTLTNPLMLTTPNGIEWPIYWKKMDGRNISLAEGWKDFYNHYELDIGSFIIFQYNGSSNFSVFVYDLSTCKIPYTHFDCVNMDKKHEFEVGQTSTKNALTLPCINVAKSAKGKHVIQNFKSDNPVFAFDITIATLSARILANVPRFTHNERLNEHNVLLWNGQREWPLKFKSYKNKSTGCLFGGWSNFASECNLKAGQVCVFELIADNPATLQVHTF